MTNTRKRYSSEYKVKVVLEILSNSGTLTEIAGKYGLHPTMISTLKAEFIEKSKEIFADPRIKKVDCELKQKEEALDEVHRQIGQLIIERDWLKKNINSLDEFDHKRKLSLIDVNFHLLTITRQTQLLGISRSNYYYQTTENPQKNKILNKLDEIYTNHPFLGSRRLHILLKQEGIEIGRHKTKSLMKIGTNTCF